LQFIEGDLKVTENAKLESMNEPSLMTHIQGDLYIDDNQMLTTIDGLMIITTIEGNLWFSQTNVCQSVAYALESNIDIGWYSTVTPNDWGC
jgi:hypothetical protein